MRRLCGAAAVVMALVMSSVTARAQSIDPTTGMPYDPVSDPVGYAMDMAQQAAAQAQAQAQEAAAQASAAAQQFAQQAMDNMNDTSQAADATVLPQLPRTPKPSVTPKGGNFSGSVVVTVTDADAQALLHITTDGSKPTTASPLYMQPIRITCSTKVRVLAIEDGDRPSSVVTKRFKQKS